MKTAVEWLVEELWNEGYFPYGVPEDIVKRADKMFEGQIKEAWFDGVTNWDSEKEVEDYINETFKSE